VFPLRESVIREFVKVPSILARRRVAGGPRQGTVGKPRSAHGHYGAESMGTLRLFGVSQCRVGPRPNPRGFRADPASHAQSDAAPRRARLSQTPRGTEVRATSRAGRSSRSDRRSATAFDDRSGIPVDLSADVEGTHCTIYDTLTPNSGDGSARLVSGGAEYRFAGAVYEMREFVGGGLPIALLLLAGQ